jgi:hypothetical protein
VLEAEEGGRTVLEQAAAEEGDSGTERQLEQVRLRAISGCQHQAQLRPKFYSSKEGELGHSSSSRTDQIQPFCSAENKA